MVSTSEKVRMMVIQNCVCYIILKGDRKATCLRYSQTFLPFAVIERDFGVGLLNIKVP